VSAVELRGVTKRYPNGYEAVRELDLDIEEGELLVLVGPSGCGKTSVLRVLAGLEAITSGTIRIGDREMTGVPSRDRDIAMVFQSYALYPHMTVAQNIGFSLRLHGLPRAEIDRRVAAVADLLDLSPFLGEKPSRLSGGQRQRVAMGRAIVREPSLFLMDEPLSNLDAKLRVEMRVEVARLQRRLGVATLYVTHDQTEAMTMSDRVAVLRDGVLQQCDRPQVVYDRPANMFVAGFMGSPSMNFLEGTLAVDGRRIAFGSRWIELPETVFRSHPDLLSYAGRRIALGVRPENVRIAPGGDADPVLDVLVAHVESLGAELHVHATVEETALVARIEPGVRVAAGERCAFALAAERLHFFDPASGIAVG